MYIILEHSKITKMLKSEKYYKLDCQQMGVSMPRATIEKIDELRGDVTRSRFVARILETTLNVNVRQNLENAFGIGTPARVLDQAIHKATL